MSKRLEPRESGVPKEPGRPDSCPECDCDRLYTDDVRGELVCSSCGYVVKNDLIDRRAEWVSFSQDEKEQNSRVGIPLTEAIHDKGLTTRIHWQDVDAYGRKLPAKKRKQMHRLREWQTRIRTGQRGERNLQFALTEIHRMSSALGVPRPTREVAAVIYREALDANLIRGRSIEAVAAGTLYIACRQENIPRSLDEIANVARIERIEIARAYRHLAAEMGIMLEPVDPKRFVPRFCSELELDKDVQKTAIETLETAIDEGLHSGKSPTALAAAAIYIGTILCDTECTQTEIADIAHVTEVTIRKRYREQLAAVTNSETEDFEGNQELATHPEQLELLLESE
jgi:transcription initiation factor TFIIB